MGIQKTLPIEQSDGEHRLSPPLTSCMTLGMSLPLYSTKTALRFLMTHLSSSFFSVVILLNLSPKNVALWARPYSTLSAYLVSKTVISPGSPGFYSYCSSPSFSVSFPSSFSIVHTSVVVLQYLFPFIFPFFTTSWLNLSFVMVSTPMACKCHLQPQSLSCANAYLLKIPSLGKIDKREKGFGRENKVKENSGKHAVYCS